MAKNPFRKSEKTPESEKQDKALAKLVEGQAPVKEIRYADEKGELRRSPPQNA